VSFIFNSSAGPIIVPAKITGPDGDSVAHLALDTAATTTLIDKEILKLAGYDPNDLTQQVKMIGVDSEETVNVVTIEKLEALGVASELLSVVCHSLPAQAGVDGVLGLNFFRGRRLMIDFRLGIVSID